MEQKKRKAVQISVDIMKRFKIHCLKNGLKMGHMVDRAIMEWLDKEEKK